MICPVCKAQNVQDTICRRCRADLSPLCRLDEHQRRLLAEASLNCSRGRWAAAMGLIDVAAELKADEKVRRYQALLSLLLRDYPAAWGAYLRQRRMQRS